MDRVKSYLKLTSFCIFYIRIKKNCGCGSAKEKKCYKLCEVDIFFYLCSPKSFYVLIKCFQNNLPPFEMVNTFYPF